MNKYNLVVLPVLNNKNELIGRITVDDVLSTFKEETDKDYQMASGLFEDININDNIFAITRSRLPWLIIGTIGGIIGAQIIGLFDLKNNLEIAFFIPLIAAMGGNVGVQSSAIVVQGLANLTIKKSDIITKLSREFLISVINGLALQGALENNNVPTRLQTAIKIEAIAEPFIKRKATRHLEKGRVVIFAAGTGNPYFTTDTAAALRASEMKCNAMFKATNVDGVYSSDPKKNKNATRYEKLKYMDVLGKDLKVMDAAAISLARENNVPVIVFSIHEIGAFSKVVSGDGKFTIIQ